MGGKASAEIANLYCYSIESQYIDKLVKENKLKDAQTWLNTWRYIDDMHGFRNRPWDDIDYGMSHIDTTDVPYNLLTRTCILWHEDYLTPQRHTTFRGTQGQGLAVDTPEVYRILFMPYALHA